MFQDEKNQLLITNLWLKLVSPFFTYILSILIDIYQYTYISKGSIKLEI